MSCRHGGSDERQTKSLLTSALDGGGFRFIVLIPNCLVGQSVFFCRYLQQTFLNAPLNSHLLICDLTHTLGSVGLSKHLTNS